jgi:hypothetical protein
MIAQCVAELIRIHKEFEALLSPRNIATQPAPASRKDIRHQTEADQSPFSVKYLGRDGFISFNR